MNYKMVFNEISNSIETNSVDKLSDSLNQAYINGPRSAKYKSAICFGYQYLAKRISDPAKIIQSLDRARLMFPSDKELLEDELNYLVVFIESKNIELSANDYKLIEAIISIIIVSVPKSSIKNTNEIRLNIKNKLFKGNESKSYSNCDSNMVCETGAYLYFNLTDDIRNKLTKELTPHIPKLFEAAKKLGLFDELEEKRKKEKED